MQPLNVVRLVQNLLQKSNALTTPFPRFEGKQESLVSLFQEGLVRDSSWIFVRSFFFTFT